jgi:hypothetical protein
MRLHARIDLALYQPQSTALSLLGNNVSPRSVRYPLAMFGPRPVALP